MKITKTQLAELIKESVRRHLLEQEIPAKRVRSPYVAKVSQVTSSGLRKELPGVSMKAVISKFRRGLNKNAFDEYHVEEKGYGPHEVHFQDKEGNVYIVYERNNIARIGVDHRTSDEDVENFATWLMSSISTQPQ